MPSTPVSNMWYATHRGFADQFVGRDAIVLGKLGNRGFRERFFYLPVLVILCAGLCVNNVGGVVTLSSDTCDLARIER
jgi:hypothetical protein